MKEEGTKKEPYRPRNPESLRVSIVRSRFHPDITGSLRKGAIEELASAGIPEDQIFQYDVPGAFELPRAVNTVLNSGKHLQGVIAIGAVVRGETPHFDYICEAATDGLQEISIHSKVPVIFGVLTCDTLEQAKARSEEDGQNNKGREAARALLDMIRFENQFS